MWLAFYSCYVSPQSGNIAYFVGTSDAAEYTSKPGVSTWCQPPEPICSSTGNSSYKPPPAVSSESPAFHPTGCILEMHLHSFISSVAALVLGAVPVHASPLRDSGELRTRKLSFRSQMQKDLNLRYVENSGICETTPGVTQYSGYIDVGKNMSMVSMIW